MVPYSILLYYYNLYFGYINNFIPYHSMVSIPFHLSPFHSTCLNSIPPVSIPLHLSQFHSTCLHSTPPVSIPFQVMGSEYDNLDSQDNPDCLAFETVYSLLDNISPSYQSSFHDALADKLIRVQQTGDTTRKVGRIQLLCARAHKKLRGGEERVWQ